MMDTTPMEAQLPAADMELVDLTQESPVDKPAATNDLVKESLKAPTPAKKTMFNYFTKLPAKAAVTEVENPRKIPPSHNKQHVEEFQLKLEQFDSELEKVFSQTEGEYKQTYFVEWRSNSKKPYKFNRKIRGPLRARLLQFCEDVRPPYFGTWQKKSKLVTARRPFGKDSEAFDYEVDSEAEWDIGGPGESLRGDDSDDEEDLDEYEIDMKTFVPHGYVSDDELDVNSDCEDNLNRSNNLNCDEENIDSNSSVKLIGEITNNNRRTSTNDNQNNQPHPVKQTPKFDLKPITIGINFDGADSTLSDSKQQFLKTFQGVSCS